MGEQKLKIIVIGLPLFAERVASNLSKFDPYNTYISLDTYYSKKNKLKYLYHLLSADIIYSINGTYVKSFTVDIALRLGKKVILHWVGTDLLKAKKAFSSNSHYSPYIEKCTHWAEVSWIKKDLEEIGIQSEIVNFAGFDVNKEPDKVPNEFSVLTYISKDLPEFYGINSIVELAKRYPNVSFKVMGCKLDYADCPNLKFLGWVNNVPQLIDESVVCIRYIEHDGLSNFVLETLSKGKRIIYSNDFPGVDYCPNDEVLYERFKSIYEDFNNGTLMPNTEGYLHIKKEFSSEYIFGGLVDRFHQIEKISNVNKK